MKKKWILTTLLTPALLSGIIFSDAHAQFKKYKSKTNFSRSKSKTSSIKDVLKSDSGKDQFGRTATVVNAKSKDDKYVNLNPETAFGPEVITSFDFPNTTLLELTKHMQKLTGINLIYDDKMKSGKVNISAPAPITVGDAWKAYLTALNINGYSLVKSGAFYKIVSTKDIRYTKTQLYTGSFTPDTDSFVMKIIPLRHINVKEVERAYRPFQSRSGRIYSIAQTNTIVIQDTGSNINRFMKIIKFIDVPGHEDSLQIIPVRHSSAQEIVKILQNILKTTGRSSKSRVTSTAKTASIGKLTAEPRTNAIIAMTNAAGAEQLRGLVKKLDVEMVSTNSGKIHVYYLNHGNAETLEKTLSKLVSGSKSKSRSSRFSKSISSRTSAGNSLFSEEVKITADKENNALVITASPTDYLTIKSVIRKLDIARDQVHVEGIIMETSMDDNTGFGISIIGAYGTGNAQRAGFTGGSNDLVNLLMGNITSLGGFFAGAGIGKKIVQTLPDGSTQTINSVNGLISAIASNNNSNVLATPQITTMDNLEGSFEVGESIPVPKQTDTANGSSTTSIDYQKVVMNLKITPQINKVSRTIKMKINQKIEDFSNRKVESQGGVATVTRSIDTNVTAKDGDTIAMGGLMRDKQTDSVSKVPLLGDIPVLGWLFKHKSKSVSKMNLLFFLTPKIIASDDNSSPETVKDLLNRRTLHLEEMEGKDPYENTVKGLYEKAQKSTERNSAPLENFNNDESEQLEDSGDIDLTSYERPNYKLIAQKVKSQKASTKRN